MNSVNLNPQLGRRYCKDGSSPEGNYVASDLGAGINLVTNIHSLLHFILYITALQLVIMGKSSCAFPN
jgi:hypothetical protein